MNGYMANMTVNEFEGETRLKTGLAIVLFSIIGFIIIIVSWIWSILYHSTVWTKDTLQLQFWWSYCFTNKYYNLSKSVLDNLNFYGKSKFGQIQNKNKKLRWMDYHYIYCLKVIRKKYHLEQDIEWMWMNEWDKKTKHSK